MAAIKLSRLRKSGSVRDIFSEARLQAINLVQPYFAIEGRNKKVAIESMPGIYRLSIDNLLKDVEESARMGIKAVLIFGIPEKKDDYASQAYKKNGIIQKAAGAIKKNIKDITVITDVCLCGFTSHGHCGIVRQKPELCIDNDETIKILAKIALSHAEAGADFVAPSAMMDGQVKEIRSILDRNNFKGTGILSYSTKYASNFYGPFREAMDSAPAFGDRKTYQMDYRNSDEAMREIQEDIKEGADIIMVKPALAYLDIIYRAKKEFRIPLAAYNVSGEYSLIKKLSENSSVMERDLALEVLTSIKRAGADIIITYYARQAARWLV